MGSKHYKNTSADNWICDDVDIPLMSLKDMFSTVLCDNTADIDTDFTALEREWCMLIDMCEVTEKSLIELIVNEVLFHEKEI